MFKSDLLRFLLRPLVQYCLRHAHTYTDLANTARGLFIELAQEEIRKTSEKVNVSRISVLTGINRKDVTRIFREKQVPSTENPSLLSRVVAQWENDKRFTTSSGSPRILNFRGDNSEFRRLVEAVSQDLNAGTVQFELERRGLATRTPKGLKLLGEIHYHDQDSERVLNLIGRDITTIIQAGEENLMQAHSVKNLHLRTEGDNIYHAAAPEVRRWLLAEGTKFHKRVRAYIAKHDQDVSPRAKGGENAGVKVVFGTFSTVTEPEK